MKSPQGEVFCQLFQRCEQKATCKSEKEKKEKKKKAKITM